MDTSCACNLYPSKSWCPVWHSPEGRSFNTHLITVAASLRMSASPIGLFICALQGNENCSLNPRCDEPITWKVNYFVQFILYQLSTLHWWLWLQSNLLEVWYTISTTNLLSMISYNLLGFFFLMQSLNISGGGERRERFFVSCSSFFLVPCKIYPTVLNICKAWSYSQHFTTFYTNWSRQ